MRSDFDTSHRLRTTVLATAVALLACGNGPADSGAGGDGDARPGSPGARWDLLEMLREDAAHKPHAADGGGRAWLERAEGDTEVATAGRPGRFSIVYEVGPAGIATGGGVFLQISPFWGWSTPQVEVPDAPGFTEIEVDSEEMELRAATLDQQLLGLEVVGRPLAPGEQVRMTFGSGSWGATADTFAEKNSRFWIAVDGDGDGAHAFLLDSPGIDVRPGEPARLQLTLPSIARPGEAFPIVVAVLDAMGSAGAPVVGEVVFEERPPGLEMPERIVLTPEDEGHQTLNAVAHEAGVIRLRARGPGELAAESNPLLVTAGGPRILWGDLHGHSALSDGTGTPEDYFRYARDVAGLDVIALTDHDHWGIPPLASTPANWQEIQRQVKRFHAPGRFVTLLGYEWTSWVYGHRHVLYFGDEGEVYSSVDATYESPSDLWKALEGQPALTFAHHSAGGPIATDWTFPPDPVLEPLTEIVSVHGSSEALDSPGVIYSAVPGNFVRDVLDRGYRFGFVGSGDSHDGHPGLTQIAGSSGGLAAILSDDRTREGVLKALRARRVYATNGPRIVLRAALGEHPMGSTIAAPGGGAVRGELFVHAIAPDPIERVDLIRSGEVVDFVATEGLHEVVLQRPVEDLASGEYLYVRVVQENGGAAWSSPIYVE
ncbi:MAG: CehA/McbA family metallohydrolase [Myxococcales bacterium]|nr:CehA/McbA family metallohydrolase [Myxococcales bacterium]